MHRNHFLLHNAPSVPSAMYNTLYSGRWDVTPQATHGAGIRAVHNAHPYESPCRPFAQTLLPYRVDASIPDRGGYSD